MPRPADVTDEMLAEWEDSWEPQIKMMAGMVPGLREANLVGDWMYRELSDREVPRGDIERIAFSFGQQAFYAEDKWELAREMLEQFFEDGSYEQPGPELAKRLIEGNE